MHVPCLRPGFLLLLQARLSQHVARQQGPSARRMSAVACKRQHEREAAPPAGQERGRVTVLAANPTATQLLAHYFACELHAADCYLLYGSVGAGKSYFSRSFIRAAAADEDLPVPSPTFLLQNIYSDHPGPAIHHFDLYRLTERYDLARLDLRASFTQAVSLVEWPERLGPDLLPAEHLAVHISILEAAEQQQLQRRLAAAAAHERRSTDEAEGSDDEGSGDTRWRRIQLSPVGQRWLPRLQLLQRYLSSEGAELGCHLESSTL